jgi:putative YhdH/YhfP family quinone oxidoreductase
LGSLAVALFAHQGYRVAAASGKPEARDFLLGLGASQIIDRHQISSNSGKALLPKRWAGVVDTVGGDILSSAIRSAQPNGIIASCGNAASADLHLTVYPFIIRGVCLLGIDSATCRMDIRRRVWRNLACDWKSFGLDEIYNEIPLIDLEEHIQRMLTGGQIGRLVVNLS